MHYFKTLTIATMALLTTMGFGVASEYKIDGIVIEHPFTRATPPKARVAGGYMKITNNGSQMDRLVGGAAAFSKRVEIHEMSMENDVMRMRPLPDGLEIAPGATVELKPGSYHMMFMSISEPMQQGAKHTVTLRFEKAGEIDLEIAVESMNAGAKGGMNHGEKMDHSNHKTN